MQTRQLGTSDLHITPIGIGAWAMGGGNWVYSWGDQDDSDSIAAIHRALDLGINWIDTAPVYGLGHAEEVVGRAIKGLSNKPYIFTKCSRIWDEQGKVGSLLKRDSILREVEDSLRRLQVEVIDLYQMHWPRPEEDIEEGWEAMALLKAQGKVRHIGVSNFSPEQMQRIQPIAPITSLQPPYSLIRPEIEAKILPFCAAHKIGVIVYSPMASGLLSGKMTRERIAAFPEDDWRKRSEQFQEPKLSRNLALADVLKEIGAQYGRSAAEVAIAWTLRLPAVTGAIVGARNPAQVDGFIGAADLRLSAADLKRIDDFMREQAKL